MTEFSTNLKIGSLKLDELDIGDYFWMSGSGMLFRNDGHEQEHINHKDGSYKWWNIKKNTVVYPEFVVLSRKHKNIDKNVYENAFRDLDDAKNWADQNVSSELHYIIINRNGICFQGDQDD